jgi:signal transduction histidine kinase/ligand-binding sensor domain-containing protein
MEFFKPPLTTDQENGVGAGLTTCSRIPQALRRSALPLLLLAALHNCFGLDRDRTIAEFLHTGWAVSDGAPSGVHGLAQTTDGYLWLASVSGLIRFDGVRFVRYEAMQGTTLQSRDISALLATPDGGLWIGRTGGATFLKNGRTVTYGRNEGLPLATVSRFVMDRQGRVWAATTRGLERFENSRWSNVGPESGFSAESATDLFLDSRGNLWVTAPGALFCLPPNSRSFQMRKITNPWLIREAPDRTRWMSEYGVGIRAVSGQLSEFPDPSKPTLALPGGPHEVLVDRDGSMWFTDNGIARIANPEALPGVTIGPTSGLIQRFTQKDGLTADTVLTAFEDREGNIWVATTAGIDRFRRRNIVPGPFPFGSDHALALVTDPQGTVFAGGDQALMQFQNGRVSVRAKIQMPLGYQYPQTSIRCAYQDSEGTFWLGGHGMLTRVAGNRVENVALPAEVPPDGHWDVQALTRDHTGDLWVSIQQHGVFRRRDGVWTRFGKQEGLPERTPVSLWTDNSGRVWIAYVGTRIAVVDGEQVRVFSSSDVHIGNVTFIGGRGAHIWVAGQFGFAMFDENRLRSIADETDPDFRGISGVVETANGDFWLNQATGVAHIPAAEIASRLQGAHHQLRYELFDFRDGVPGSATSIEPLPSAVLAGDGRIWMSGSNGTYWVDPARIYKNPLPPPVTIETIYADDRPYDPSQTSRLPALPSNVRIEYAALSLSIPERVRFRYQLEGVDKGWQDGGTRRAAYYTKLPPGHFRFHVIACNNDAVWNRTGAVAAIVVPLAFFQTMWFQGLCVCAALAFLWMLYLFRLRQVSAQMHGRLEERLAERTRIARELHDTLLQSFQGLMLRFQVVNELLPSGKAKEELERALERGDQAIAEGRDAVGDLRSSTVVTNDLARAIGDLGNELASCQDSAAFRLVVEGPVRDLHPIMRDEVYRIAREALRNSFSHSRAHQIEAEITYGERLLRLRIRDNGAGIPPAILEAGRSGHYGLSGMRERARQIGASLDIWSGGGTGTEIDLSIPGSIAYGNPTRRSRLQLFRKKAG